jgi:hypothetical protein
MPASSDLFGFHVESQESHEEPVVRESETQRMSMLTATVPPMAYSTDLFLLVRKLILA